MEYAAFNRLQRPACARLCKKLHLRRAMMATTILEVSCKGKRKISRIVNALIVLLITNLVKPPGAPPPPLQNLTFNDRCEECTTMTH